MRGRVPPSALLAWIVALVLAGGAAGNPPSAAGAAAGDPQERSAAATTPVPGARERPLNLVVLTIDSLRADHVGVYGYDRPTTPRIDALAERSWLFESARAVSAWTFPGLVSLFTGRYPADHGFGARGQEIREVPTLQGLLASAGYRVPTLTHVATVPGMEGLRVEEPWRPVARDRPVGDLVAWLRSEEAAAGPFMAWSHHRGPHLPYDAAPEHQGPFGPVADTPSIAQLREYVIVPAVLQSFAPEESDDVVALYDAELRQVDAYVGEVVAALEETGLAERTLLVITADHGEELLDHGLVGHASTTERGKLYEEVLRVPMVVRVPGATPARFACPVSQVDVLPTLLSVLGVEAPEGLAGVDLARLAAGDPCPYRPLFAESIQGGFQARGESARTFLWAVVEEGWKLIRVRDGDGDQERELYDLAADPRERIDLSGSRPERTALLQARLDTFLDRRGGPDYWRSLEEAPGRGRRITRVASAPQILAPEPGSTLGYPGAGGTLTGRWSGSPEATYVIEYDVGTGRFRTTGEFTVEGNRYSYGPVPPDVWNGLTQFNPWRVRVYPALAPDRKSAWVTFELVPAGG